MSVERVTSVLLGVGGLESLLMYYSLKEVREVEGKGGQRPKASITSQGACQSVCLQSGPGSG